MKKILSIILAILMIVTMLPMAVLPASAISKTQDGFIVHVTYGVCKYCGDKHGIESVDIKSISVENGKVTFQLSVSFKNRGNCSKTANVKAYSGVNTSVYVFTYTITDDFSCEKSYLINESYGQNFGEDKPKLLYSISRNEGHQASSWAFNGTKHSGTCELCGKAVNDNCSGGTATCMEKATCSTCGNKYGSLASDNHDWSNLDGICANGCGAECFHNWGEGVLTRPTKTKEGYYTYTCSACGATKTEAAERATNYAEYTKALNDLRAYLDSDKLTDDAKASVAEWLEIYDSDEAYKFIAGEEETVNLYIEAALYYATEIEAAIQDCLAGNHSGNGEYCDICGATLHTCDFTGEWKYDTEKHWKECSCGETEEVAHSYIDGVCECGTMGITNIEDFGCFPDDGWYNEEGIPEEISPNVEGKIEWVNGDEITITMNSETYGTQTAVMTYQDGSWVGDIALAYDENEDLDYLLTVAYGKVDGTEEYLLAGHIIDGSTLQISFEYSDRVYSRLRLVGDANESYEISVTEFMPAGSGNLDSYNYTLTADDNGNAFLYGYFAEGSILTINGVDCTLNYLNGTISGKSYAICAVHSGTEATCKGVLCENCGLYFGEKDLSKHTLVQVDAKAPTCTEIGWDAYEYCTACDYTTKVEIPVDANAHDWSNLDGICANGCGLECPHEDTYNNLIRPVQNADGTWGKGKIVKICNTCGNSSLVQEVERDHEGYKVFDETAAELEALLNSGKMTDKWKNDYTNSLNGLRNSAYYQVYTEIETAISSMTESLKSIIAAIEAGFADGTMIKADFTYMTSLFDEINALIDNDPNKLIPSESGRFQGIYYGYYMSCKNNGNHSQFDYDQNMAGNNWEGQIEDILAGVKDGTMLKADYTTIDEAIAEIEEKLADENVTDEAKAELEEIKAELEEMKADRNTSAADLAELEKALDEYEAELDAGIEDGSALKADYTAIDEAIAEIEKKLADENVTDEAKAELEEIKSQLEEKKADRNTSAADLAELEKALDEYEAELDAGIEDGTLVEIDINKIAEELNEKWREKLEAEGLSDEYEDFISNQKATDEAKAAEKEINDFANSLEGTVAENAENIAKLKEMFDSLFASLENCLRGTHNFKNYEITSPAKCGENAIETGVCWICGETDEREVENSALTHSFTKYEEVEAPKCGVEGKEVAYCDNGCGEIEVRATEALKHSFTKYEVTEEAKCGVEGKEVAYCDNGCGATDEKAIEALKHLFVDYIYNEDATCEANGTKTAECVYGCGETDTVTAEDTMLDHVDEDGDKICDDCEAEIVDICPDCGGKAHADTGVSQYICMIITLIKLVVSLIKALQAVV